jgi:hypothetical protein
MIQQTRLPLSPDDKKHLRTFFGSSAFSVLSKVVDAHEASSLIEAGEKCVNDDDAGISRAEATETAKFFRRMKETLVQWAGENENEDSQLFTLQLSTK